MRSYVAVGWRAFWCPCPVPWCKERAICWANGRSRLAGRRSRGSWRTGTGGEGPARSRRRSLTWPAVGASGSCARCGRSSARSAWSGSGLLIGGNSGWTRTVRPLVSRSTRPPRSSRVPSAPDSASAGAVVVAGLVKDADASAALSPGHVDAILRGITGRCDRPARQPSVRAGW
jgi:hypothetical protein